MYAVLMVFSVVPSHCFPDNRNGGDGAGARRAGSWHQTYSRIGKTHLIVAQSAGRMGPLRPPLLIQRRGPKRPFTACWRLLLRWGDPSTYMTQQPIFAIRRQTSGLQSRAAGDLANTSVAEVKYAAINTVRGATLSRAKVQHSVREHTAKSISINIVQCSRREE
ncbi:hypothetical protein DFH06DRAFT_1130349 [Mycena polygramma]|nr:hypothetical protein DFH06DRAFT_1130349 [Mycena polygramma]